LPSIPGGQRLEDGARHAEGVGPTVLDWPSIGISPVFVGEAISLRGIVRVRALLLAGAALVSVCASPALAQSGGIQVQVFDASGKNPVAGASVTLSSAVGFVAATTVPTDGKGIASFPVLRVGGGYAVEVRYPAFARVRIVDIRVKTQDVDRISVRLVPEIEEHVKVVERRAAVDLDKTAKATTFDSEFLQDLPSQGRFYQSMLTLAPGVVDADGDGNPNVYGARSVDFQTQVGGVSNQDPLTGGWMSYLNSDAIEEMTVIGAGAGVEFGRAQGGFAQVIQKQGSNDFEGVANLLWRSSLMDGNSAQTTPGTKVPDYDWIQPAIQISGPIVKDRLWYRLSHEYISREEPIASRDQPIIAARRQGISSDQVTWQVSPRNKLALEFRYDPLTLTNVGATSLTAAGSTKQYETGGPTYSLAWTAAFSPTVLSDSVLSYQLSHQNVFPTTTGQRNDCTVGFVEITGGWTSHPTTEPLFPLLDTVRCTNTNTGGVSGSYPWTSRDDRERLTVKNQTSIFAGQFLGMAHQLKVGFNLENERYFRALNKRPELTFDAHKLSTTVIDEFGRNRQVEVATLDVQVATPPTTRSDATNTSYGVFVEDQVKPLSNLSLTLGLRVDREELRGLGWKAFDPAAEFADFLDRYAANGHNTYLAASQAFTAYGSLEPLVVGMSAATGLPEAYLSALISPGLTGSQDWPRHRDAGEINIVNTNPAPRFALAWDPGGKGKSKIAFTAGRYYGTIFLAVPFVEVEPATFDLVIGGRRYLGEAAWENVRVASGINPSVSVRAVDHDLKTPYQDELTLSLERELGAETMGRMSFVSRRFEDQFQDVDINHHDSFVYSPAWGTVYRVGNENAARYEAVVFELVRRQYRNWQMEASYTWSRTIGNAEEFSSYLGDDPTLRETEKGYLAYDQRNVVKVNTTTITPWGFRLGMSANWMSGLPYSIVTIGSATDRVPPEFRSAFTGASRTRTEYPTGRRNDQRNRPTLSLNVKFDKEYNLKSGQNLQLSAEVFNLLNDRYYQIYNPQLGYGRQTNYTNDAWLTPGRQYQLGARLSF
jgi:hypothetical protein